MTGGRSPAVRIDEAGEPEQAGLCSLSMRLAGDLNGDGEQDVISPQVAGFNTQGRVYVFSGGPVRASTRSPLPT